jgi:hypothetical protein
MAITNNDGSTAGKVYDGTMITSGANSKPSILLPANNNRASGWAGSTSGQGNGAPQSKTARGSSRGGTVGNAGVTGAAFTALDQSIVSLDAQYEALADKAPWVAYATNIVGEWSLCANCMPDGGAKKLFRQYNFNRELIGLPVVIAPVDDTEVCDASMQDVQWVLETGTTFETTIAVLTSEASFYIVASLGKALANPVIAFNGSDAGVSLTVPNIYSAWVQAVMTSLGFFGQPGELFGTVPMCVFNVSGAPGMRANVPCLWIGS